MQHFKSLFQKSDYFDTFTNVQKCLRLNDLSEVGDGTHYLVFDMIGLFSFRQWTVPQSIDFMWEFLRRLDCKPDYVTIHPDKMDLWSSYYLKYGIEIRPDEGCIWSDGNIGGYCTEFYKNDIEIGNIVNPLETCIDIGFGLERILQVTNNLVYDNRLDVLEKTVDTLIKSGVIMGNNKHGYILKKIITECVLLETKYQHSFVKTIRENQKKNFCSYKKLIKKDKYLQKSPDYWLDTFGIDISKIELYEKMLDFTV